MTVENGLFEARMCQLLKQWSTSVRLYVIGLLMIAKWMFRIKFLKVFLPMQSLSWAQNNLAIRP